ncbi:ribosomal biogenesis regulatory protein [Cryphonectria parasitica EP155]|uniref:Ribosome biogenesis regulatory protein n=1 Tax=Cryphonectria parasitica (strain ATCC 38755 / EP155) TaxID=660469 RepID=A0A9P4XWF6_CRYP1|nr:ribosomal biogenesis regulatory protein [Cryphonectria parasitica EP155]KAF3762562.1 ribosomal biogenesis regulatory protein [Cryphonectria parasitica EP155]
MASTTKTKLPVAVDKPTPYTFDLGLLLASDPNPPELDPSDLETTLAAVARDGAQALVNQLLTTCPLTSTKTDGVLLSLPPASTPLPREKPLPTPKPPTKWEQFAKRKGIAPKTREQRKNLAWNEDRGEWEKKWGWKGDQRARDRADGKVPQDWVVEVNANKEAALKDGETIRGEGRRERKERARRNERKMRSNARKEGK